MRAGEKFSGRIFILLSVIIAMLATVPGWQQSAAAQNLAFEIQKIHPDCIFSLQAQDVDRDGYVDIIYAGDGPDLRIKIMFGRPGGRFEPPTVIGGLGQPITIGYINNDTLLDIVGSAVYYIYILINNGDRTFRLDSLQQPYLNLNNVALGFLNEDAYIDMLVPHSYELPYIYYGDGSGRFGTAVQFPHDIEVSYVTDMNNDGLDDVVGLDGSGNGTIYLHQNGGQYIPAGTFALGEFAMASSLTEPFYDFNLDGNADFAFIAPQISKAAMRFPSKITVGYGDGAGGILGFTYLWIEGTSYALTIADADRDHDLDLATVNGSDYRIELFLGDGAGNFSNDAKVVFQTEPVSIAVANGDFDRDGNTDFITGSNGCDSVLLFINQFSDQSILAEQMFTTGYSNVALNIYNPGGYCISRNFRTVAGSSYWRLDANADNAVDEQAADYNVQYGEYRIVIKPAAGVTPGTKFTAGTFVGNRGAILFKGYDTPSDSLIFYYTVSPASLTTPGNGQPMRRQNPFFRWSGLVSNPAPNQSYQFQLDLDFDFRAPLIDQSGLTLPSYSPSITLGNDSVYYWRFRHFDGATWSEYSRTMAFLAVEYLRGDVNQDALINIRDITFLIRYLYIIDLPPLPLEVGDADCSGLINIADVTYLINYIYRSGPPPYCP